ncbi:uncharacterized protein LOC134531466 [Bacillus rossius redtenbacheri]|uniref:uncharacterized protein LOC134531466 n=1 Tax=Bacillus rossius redtenbacheri TaxID=93214 RepID=UPI002FDEF9D8
MRRILRICAFVIIDVLFAELCTCMPTPQFYSGSPVVELPGAAIAGRASPRASGGAGVSTDRGCRDSETVETSRTLVSAAAGWWCDERSSSQGRRAGHAQPSTCTGQQFRVRAACCFPHGRESQRLS